MTWLRPLLREGRRLRDSSAVGERAAVRTRIVWSIILLGATGLGVVAAIDPDLPRFGLERATATIGPLLSSNRGIAITEPIRISSSPDVSIVSGTIVTGSLLEPFVSEARATIGAQTTLVIDDAVIVVRTNPRVLPGRARDREPAFDLAALIASRGIGKVAITGGVLQVEGLGWSEVRLTRIDATADLSRGSDVALLTGTLDLLGESFAFDISLDTGAKADAGASRPMSVRLASARMNAAFEGGLGTGDGIGPSGVVSVRIADLGALAGKLGIAAPGMLGLVEVEAEGGITIADGVASLNASRIATPRSQATGTIALRLRDGKPVIDGTLDFSRLDLSGLAFEQHLLAALPSPEGPFVAAPSGSPGLAGLDADIRLSAAQLRFAGQDMGPVAATMSVQGPSISGQIAELALLGGHATGQIAILRTAGSNQVSISGTASQLRLSREIAALIGIDAIAGSLIDVRGQVGGTGKWAADIVSTLTGAVRIALIEGGVVRDGGAGAVALLIDTALKSLSDGATATGRPLTLDALTAELQFGGGKVRARDFELILGGERLAGRGIVGVADSAIDLQIWPMPAGKARAGARSPGPAAIRLGGTWQQPRIEPAERGEHGAASGEITAAP